MINFVKIKDLKEYEKNPRNNDEAVEFLKNSIKEFGFKVPIVIDKNNIIVCGHTRVKAAKKLKMETVPCVVADDLTDEQIKAFRLVDNKVAEKSKWNSTLLRNEILNLKKFDFTSFGFEFNTNKINERINTIKTYNLDLFNKEQSSNKWGIPILDFVDYVPSDLIGFNYAKTSKEYNKGIHFYLDDYQFERLWNRPKEYFDLLSNFDCLLSPDFSLYLEMPLAMQLWNVYRSRVLSREWQNMGLVVIPTVSWADEDSFEFCFEGLPKNSTVSISTIGVKKDTHIFKKGLDEMINKINPSRILLYGGMIDYNFKNIEVIEYKNKVTERMSKS